MKPNQREVMEVWEMLTNRENDKFKCDKQMLLHAIRQGRCKCLSLRIIFIHRAIYDSKEIVSALIFYVMCLDKTNAK